MTINWRELPYKTIVGVSLLIAQAVVYYRAGRPDAAVDAIAVAIAVLGIRHGVAKDQAATRAVSDKIDDAHAAVVEAHSAIARTENKVDQAAAKVDAAAARLSGDSIPVARPAERDAR